MTTFKTNENSQVRLSLKVVSQIKSTGHWQLYIYTLIYNNYLDRIIRNRTELFDSVDFNNGIHLSSLNIKVQ